MDELVPGHFAEKAELYGIGRAMASVGAGAFGMNSDFVDEDAEFAWMTRLSEETERPVWFLLTDRAKDPARWKRLMRHVHAARAQVPCVLILSLRPKRAAERGAPTIGARPVAYGGRNT